MRNWLRVIALLFVYVPAALADQDRILRLGPADFPLKREEAIAKINACRAVVMDITPLAPSPNLDSDRAWILGFAFARGKPISLHTSSEKSFTTRIHDAFAALQIEGFSREPGGMKRLFDPDGYAVEEFGLHDNLMIDGAAFYSGGRVESSAERAVAFAESLSLGFNPLDHRDLRSADVEVATLYDAGPDVFLLDFARAAEVKKDTARRFGFRGRFPMDNVIEPVGTPFELAMRIFAANVRMMGSTWAVVPNMTRFRGPDMDEGTAWEIGFFDGMNRPIAGYSTSRLPVSQLPVASVRASVGSLKLTYHEAVAELKLLYTTVRADERAIHFCRNSLENASAKVRGIGSITDFRRN